MTVTQAAILAAGEGTKLGPYSNTRPKALFPVANEPVIDRLISQLQRRGVERFAVARAETPLGKQLSGHVADREHVHVTSTDATGTAHALDSCFSILDEDAPLAVVYGDVVTADSNLTELWETFERGVDGPKSEVESVGACLIDEPPWSERRGWIEAVTDGEPGETAFLERLIGAGRSPDWRLSGIFLFSPEMVRYVRGNSGIMRSVPVGGMPPLEAELAASVNDALDDGLAMHAVSQSGYHVDIDKPWHVWEANHEAVVDAVGDLDGDQVHPSASVSENARIDGNVRLGPECEIGDRVTVEGNLWMMAGSTMRNGAIVGENCLIGPDTHVTDYCKLGSETVLGANCRIGHAAEFSGVCFDGVAIVHYSELYGVIGEGSDIGAATVCGTLRFDDDRTVHETDGFREKPSFGANGCYIGDHCRTGVNTILMPGVTVGPYSCVGPGVIASDDVPPQTLLVVDQDYVEKDWGPDRYGW